MLDLTTLYFGTGWLVAESLWRAPRHIRPLTGLQDRRVGRGSRSMRPVDITELQKHRKAQACSSRPLDELGLVTYTGTKDVKGRRLHLERHILRARSVFQMFHRLGAVF